MASITQRTIKAIALGIACLAPAAHAGFITIESDRTSYQIGDTVTVNMSVSGLSSAPYDSLAAFDVDFLYSAGLLTYQLTSFSDPILGNQLQDDSEIGAFPFYNLEQSYGNILDIFATTGNSADALDAYQQDEFIALSLTFIAEAIGFAEVSLDTNDPWLIFSDSNFDDIDFTVANNAQFSITDSSSVSVDAPPMTAIFLSAALFALGFRKTTKEDKA